MQRLYKESASSMSVSMGPGHTTFAVMLRLANSFASDFAIPIRPALLAA